MNKVTFTPTVTETKVIEVSPATVTINLTVDEAAMVLALVGKCSGSTYELYNGLDKLKNWQRNWPEYEVSIHRSTTAASFALQVDKKPNTDDTRIEP